MSDVLAGGTLKSGALWRLIKSRKSAVSEGEHLQLLFTDGRLECTEAEKVELYMIAEKHAFARASKNDDGQERFRIARNGPGQAKRQSFHIHIILPAGDDHLPRLVEPVLPSI